MSEEIELTVVMPCLDEADTIATCIREAESTLAAEHIAGEIVVADNGSTDGSGEIARGLGARVVHVRERGYGSALAGGIGAARGRYVVMADADASYDFREIPRFLAKLREGYDLVQGCRLPSGGGRIAPGAMPFLHRWVGNPWLSFLARLMFGVPVHDVYCGMRGFRRDFYERLDQRCTGMEFATEMIVKAALQRASVAEVPITLRPDARRSHPPHLRTLRDGWRTLRFFLLWSPGWLFLFPGASLALLGVIGYALALPGVTIGPATFDAHTLLVSSLALTTGYQFALFAIVARAFAAAEGLLPASKSLMRLLQGATVERGALGSLALVLLGLPLIASAALDWQRIGFGSLDYATTMRRVIPGVTLVALGFQTLFSSFLLSLFAMGRR